MRVEQSQQAEAVKAQSGLASSVAPDPAKTQFASVLAKTATKADDATGGSNTTPAAEPNTSKQSGKLGGPDKASKSAPKGEKTQAVKDHPAYIEVTAGPRNGMFLNKTSNERSGEAFVMVKKDDRDLHVYGTGKDRRVIISWHKDQPAHADEYRADGTKKTEKSPKTDSGGVTAPSSS